MHYRLFCIITKYYSCPLNSTGLNCIGPLGFSSISLWSVLNIPGFHICGFIYPLPKRYFRSTVGNLWMRTDYALFCAILYEGLEHPQSLLSAGILGPTPWGYWGATEVKFLGVKSYMWIFKCMGVDASKPHVIQIC